MTSRSQKLNEYDVQCIVRDVVEHGQSASYIARLYGISRQRVYQLCKHYRETNKIPVLKPPGRKRYRGYPAWLGSTIEESHKRYGIGATLLAQMLRFRYDMKIDNNYVHEILLLRGLAMEDPKKKKRRKPWIRYERKHSLSAVHMDWTQLTSSGIWACAVLDDASRMILAMVETPHATAQASVVLLEQAYRKYEHIRPIQSVIVDHGTQFYANKRDKDGNAKHIFEQYCESRGIQLILCKYHHPQSNGKIERFFQTYKK